MKMKKEYLILAAITVALVAYLVSRNPNRNLYELPQLAQATIKDVTKIELASSNGNIILTKEGSDWKISPDKFLADSQKIKEMLTVMENLTLTELISESKNYNRYDLDPAKSIELRLWEKDDLRDKPDERERMFHYFKSALDLRNSLNNINSFIFGWSSTQTCSL